MISSLHRLTVTLLLTTIASISHAQTTSKPTLPDVPPDIKAEHIWDGRKLAPFKAIDNPPMVSAFEASFLDESDYVLGVTINGESRAYPTRFIWFHHVINDVAGKSSAGGAVPFSVSYCSVCNTGIAYDPIVDGKTVKIDFYGLYNGVVILCERVTESVLLQVEGRFITGPLMNKRLPFRPVLDTTWAQWKELHPDTLVMSPETPFQRFYSPRNKPEPRGYPKFPAPYFQPSLTREDPRLPKFDKVLGVTVTRGANATRRAYSIKLIAEKGGAVNDSLDGTPITLLFDAETQAANAFVRKVGKRTLSFEVREVDGKSTFFDRETETSWNIEGVGLAGPLAGKKLERLENHLSQWYGWAAYYPATSVYRVPVERATIVDPFGIDPFP